MCSLPTNCGVMLQSSPGMPRKDCVCYVDRGMGRTGSEQASCSSTTLKAVVFPSTCCAQQVCLVCVCVHICDCEFVHLVMMQPSRLRLTSQHASLAGVERKLKDAS